MYDEDVFFVEAELIATWYKIFNFYRSIKMFI